MENSSRSQSPVSVCLDGQGFSLNGTQFPS